MLAVVDGDESWDYSWKASPGGVKPGPPKEVTPALYDGRDMERINRGELLDVSGFENTIRNRLVLDPNYVSPLDRQGDRTPNARQLVPPP